MPQLSKRTDTFTDSVIRRMTRISLQYGAVNLSQGFPDFDPPRAILDRLAEVANEDFHQYSITWGAQNFREALAAKQSHFMGYPFPGCMLSDSVSLKNDFPAVSVTDACNYSTETSAVQKMDCSSAHPPDFHALSARPSSILP